MKFNIVFICNIILVNVFLVVQLFQSAELKKGNTKYAINQSHTNNLIIA
tara:strand:+ start:385 stop:531 length:147 start_codon:yes stop_codon:yes gene_type:complete